MPEKCIDGLLCRLHYRDYHVGWTGWKTADGSTFRSQLLGTPFVRSVDGYLEVDIQIRDYSTSATRGNRTTRRDWLSQCDIELLKSIALMMTKIDQKVMK